MATGLIMVRDMASQCNWLVSPPVLFAGLNIITNIASNYGSLTLYDGSLCLAGHPTIFQRSLLTIPWTAPTKFGNLPVEKKFAQSWRQTNCLILDCAMRLCNSLPFSTLEMPHPVAVLLYFRPADSIYTTRSHLFSGRRNPMRIISTLLTVCA